MKIRIGDFERYGTKKTTDGMMFTFALFTEEDCAICLYDRKNKTLIEEVTLPDVYRIGQVYSVELMGSKWERYCYRIRQGKQLYVDPYATSIAGREVWNDTMRFGQDDGCYGAFDVTYELPAQRGRWIEAQDMVMYKLHMRGFTMQHGFKNAEKGTDAGILAGLSYLQKLGITSLEFQPFYEFEEVFYEKRQSLDENGTSLVTYVPQEKTNYWGYGDAYYFAPKASYFGGIQAPQRCRTMI